MGSAQSERGRLALAGGNRPRRAGTARPRCRARRGRTCPGSALGVAPCARRSLARTRGHLQRRAYRSAAQRCLRDARALTGPGRVRKSADRSRRRTAARKSTQPRSRAPTHRSRHRAHHRRAFARTTRAHRAHRDGSATPDAAAHRSRSAHTERAAHCPNGSGRSDQHGDRPGSVRDAQDGRDASHQHVSQTRHQLARPTGPRLGRTAFTLTSVNTFQRISNFLRMGVV